MMWKPWQAADTICEVCGKAETLMQVCKTRKVYQKTKGPLTPVALHNSVAGKLQGF
jgi:hypothetical protein